MAPERTKACFSRSVLGTLLHRRFVADDWLLGDKTRAPFDGFSYSTRSGPSCLVYPVAFVALLFLLVNRLRRLLWSTGPGAATGLELVLNAAVTLAMVFFTKLCEDEEFGVEFLLALSAVLEALLLVRIRRSGLDLPPDCLTGLTTFEFSGVPVPFVMVVILVAIVVDSPLALSILRTAVAIWIAEHFSMLEIEGAISMGLVGVLDTLFSLSSQSMSEASGTWGLESSLMLVGSLGEQRTTGSAACELPLHAKLVESEKTHPTQLTTEPDWSSSNHPPTYS